jgi:hypothetical protein
VTDSDVKSSGRYRLEYAKRVSSAKLCSMFVCICKGSGVDVQTKGLKRDERGKEKENATQSGTILHHLNRPTPVSAQNW